MPGIDMLVGVIRGRKGRWLGRWPFGSVRQLAAELRELKLLFCNACIV